MGLVTVCVFDWQQIGNALEKNSTDLRSKLSALKANLRRLEDEKEGLTQKQKKASYVCDSLKQKLEAAQAQAESTGQKIDPSFFWGREQPPSRFHIRIEPSTLYKNSEWIERFEKFRPRTTKI